MSFMPSCREVQTELTEYTEGALPFSRRVGIWIHLLFCRVCAGFLRGLKALPKVARTSLASAQEAPELALKVFSDVMLALRKPEGP